ncbi:hypothetical protein [Methylobacterium iners]|uniref:hypothetical protein n=1 Tax=Methylobacterium iners TaxID=418707 RepID=UPI001EE2CF4E|nr:hypothetical protein [Methylobacterium iners]
MARRLCRYELPWLSAFLPLYPQAGSRRPKIRKSGTIKGCPVTAVGSALPFALNATSLCLGPSVLFWDQQCMLEGKHKAVGADKDVVGTSKV